MMSSSSPKNPIMLSKPTRPPLQLARPGATGIVRMVEQNHRCQVRKKELAAILAEVVDDNWSDIVRTSPSNEIVNWVNLLR